MERRLEAEIVEGATKPMTIEGELRETRSSITVRLSPRISCEGNGSWVSLIE